MKDFSKFIGEWLKSVAILCAIATWVWIAFVITPAISKIEAASAKISATPNTK